MEEENSLRMVQKLFKCPLCLKGFKKLVRVNEQFSKCPQCGHEHCSEMINSEFNRESVDSQYRLPFCNLPESVKRQYHTVTDIHDRNPNNFYLDNQRNPVYPPVQPVPVAYQAPVVIPAPTPQPNVVVIQQEQKSSHSNNCCYCKAPRQSACGCLEPNELQT